MTLKATWLLTTDLVSELTYKSSTVGIPIYVNNSFWDDLKKANLIDWITHSNGTVQSMVSSHPVYYDNFAPDYTCTQDIINYYWSKHGCLVGSSMPSADCGCRLGGAHELYCEKWQAY